MIAVHEHFRLDNRNQAGFLAQRGIARQRMRVGLNATPAGNALADGNHRPPLGKTRAHLKVFRQTFAQSVQPFGDFLSGKTSQVFCSSINFDSGNDARIGENFYKRRAVLLLLTDGLVEKNCSANAFAKAGRGHNQLPIGAPGLHRLRNVELCESFVTGRIAFIHCQQTFVVGNQFF